MFENASSGFQAITYEDYFAADSTAAIVFKSLVYFVILLVSSVCNVFLILVVWKNRPWQLCKSINYFVFNTAVSDLFMPLTIIPIRIVEIISGSGAFMVHSPLMLGNILCKLCYFLVDVSILVSIESLLLISFDRLVAALFPLKSKRITSRVHLICTLCTWIIAIAVHAPYFYTLRRFPDGNEYYCEYDWGPAFDHDETSKRYITATFFAIIVVPTCILIIVYGAIAWIVKRRHKRGKNMRVSAQSRGFQKSRQIIRLSVAITLTAFLFCMIPHIVVVFCQMFLWQWEDPPTCSFQAVIPFVALFMERPWSTVNPCICFISSKNYRRGLKKLLSYRKDSFRTQKKTKRLRSCKGEEEEEEEEEEEDRFPKFLFPLKYFYFISRMR